MINGIDPDDPTLARPRVVKLPAEDRTRKWKDAGGNMWQPLSSKSWWNSPSSRKEPRSWAELLELGPLTDAGPAEPRW